MAVVKNNKLEIDEIIQNSYDLRVSDLSGAIEMVMNARKLAVEMDYLAGVALADSRIGLYYMIQGKNELSTEYTNKALDYFRQKNDLLGIVTCLFNVGSVQNKSSNLGGSIETFLECLNIQRKIGDKRGEARTLKQWGTFMKH